MSIKIAIAEDNSFLLEALKEKISFFDELMIKFSGSNGVEITEAVEKNHIIDIILMDIQMPKMDGVRATAIIKEKYPQIKIIMLTIYDSDEHIFDAIRAGADGYLLKETNAQELYEGIVDVYKGGAAMTPSIALRTLHFIKRISNENIQSQSFEEKIILTKRESEILVQLSKGLNYNLIAENLFISTGRVRKHIENIYKKLQVHNKVEAIQKGMKYKLL